VISLVLTMRAIPERLRDVSLIGAIQIDITFTLTYKQNMCEKVAFLVSSSSCRGVYITDSVLFDLSVLLVPLGTTNWW